MLYLGVPTVNNLRYLKEMISSIKTNHSYELLIIDNGSDEETCNWVTTSEYNTILNPSNYGVAKAWNQIINWGMSFNDCDIIYILNNDIVLHKDCMDLMTQSVLEFEKEGISGLNVGNHPAMLNGVTQPEIRYSPAMHFSCFGLTPKTIKRVGLFDEGFKLAYFEDNDYHHRMGLENIESACDMWAFFTHYGSRTIKEGGVKYEPYFTQNKEFFKKKWNFLPGQ